jgi:Flp pilus assembly protein TadD
MMSAHRSRDCFRPDTPEHHDRATLDSAGRGRNRKGRWTGRDSRSTGHNPLIIRPGGVGLGVGLAAGWFLVIGSFAQAPAREQAGNPAVRAQATQPEKNGQPANQSARPAAQPAGSRPAFRVLSEAQEVPARELAPGATPIPPRSPGQSAPAVERETDEARATDSAARPPADPYPRVQRYGPDGERRAARLDRRGRIGPRGHPYPILREREVDVLFRYRGLIDLDALYDAYSLGRADEREDVVRAFNERDMDRRKERALSAHEKAIAIGVTRLREGAYAEAVIALSLAAELDQGDPACRVHLAQARVALGHYEEAAVTMRRALELQPRLAYLPLNLRAVYPQAGDFDLQVDNLVRYVVSAEQPQPEVCFLLGVLEFQRGRFAEAHLAFRHAARPPGRDDLIATYLDLTRPPRAPGR